MPLPAQMSHDLKAHQQESEGTQGQIVNKGCILPIVADKIHNLKEVYSTALGGYREWRNDVDLGPPKSGRNDFPVSLFCLACFGVNILVLDRFCFGVTGSLLIYKNAKYFNGRDTMH